MYRKTSVLLNLFAVVTCSSAYTVICQVEGQAHIEVAGVSRTGLLACTPSLFGRATAINYEVGRTGPVTLAVHDASGRVVRRLQNDLRPVGSYVASWDGTDCRGLAVPAGVYFVRLDANGEGSSRRVTLIR
jgi:flagellar hook assembly protein FlgD